MISSSVAAEFARSWYAAWNAHDLDAIMRHYAPTIEHSSPFIARYYPDPGAPSIRGAGAVRGYFAAALERNPTLAFIPRHIALGLETLVLVYHRMNGELAAEIFHFDNQGKVLRSISHYGLPGSEGAPVLETP